MLTDDPRDAKTLGEAALKPDGTWDGYRALSWLSKALDPAKKGLSLEEVKKDFGAAQAVVNARRRKALKLIEKAEKDKEGKAE